MQLEKRWIRVIFLLIAGILFLKLASAADCRVTVTLYDPDDISVDSCNVDYNNVTGQISTCNIDYNKCLVTGIYYLEITDNCTNTDVSNDFYMCDATSPDIKTTTSSYLIVKADNSTTKNYINASWNVYDKGLLLYMPFERATSEDYSQFANPAIVTSAPYLVNGYIGNGYAMHFDGDDDYINVTNGASLDLTEDQTTFSAWIKTSTASTGIWEGIIDRSNDTENCGFDQNNGDFRFFCYTDGAGSPGLVTVPETKYINGQWQHFTATYNGSHTVLWINGIINNSASLAGNIIDTNADLLIGSRTDSISSAFEGDIDEVRIYNRSLNKTEVIDLYMSGLVRHGLQYSTVADSDYSPINGFIDKFDQTDIMDNWTVSGNANISWSNPSNILKSAFDTDSGFSYLKRDSYNITGKDVLIEFDMKYAGGDRGGLVYRNDTCEISPFGTGWGTSVIGEFGQVLLYNVSDYINQTINFTQTYSNPIVVAYIMTRNNTISLEARISNITDRNATIFLQNPKRTEKMDKTEKVGYIVMETGRYVFKDGTALEAGSEILLSSHNGTNGDAYAGDTYTFTSEFSKTPVVLHSLNSYYNKNFSTSAVYDVTTTNFKATVEMAESGDDNKSEYMGWIAIDANITGFNNGTMYETGAMNDGNSDGVDDDHHLITFDQDFSSAPIVIVKQDSDNEVDGSWARANGTWDEDYAGVNAEEDQVLDSERSHADEIFGFWAFEKAGPITGFTTGISANEWQHLKMYIWGKNSSYLHSKLVSGASTLFDDNEISGPFADDGLGFYSPKTSGYWQIDNLNIVELNPFMQENATEAKDVAGPETPTGVTVSADSLNMLRISWDNISDYPTIYFFSMNDFDTKDNPTNSIANLGFENMAVTPWVTVNGGTANATSKYFYEGNWSLNVTGSGQGEGIGQYISDYGLYLNKRVLFTCRARGNGTAMNISMSGQNITGSESRTLLGDTWSEISYSGTVSASAGGVLVIINASDDKGEFYIDNCKFFETIEKDIKTGLKSYLATETTGYYHANGYGWGEDITYDDNGLYCFYSYCYNVKAQDMVGNLGSASSNVCNYPIPSGTCDYGSGADGYCLDDDDDSNLCYYDAGETSSCPSELCRDSGSIDAEGSCFYDNGLAYDRSDDCTIVGCTGLASVAQPNCISGEMNNYNATCWTGNLCNYSATDACEADVDGWDFTSEVIECGPNNSSCCNATITYIDGVNCTKNGVVQTAHDRDDAQSYCTATSVGCTRYNWSYVESKCCGDDESDDDFCERTSGGGICVNGAWTANHCTDGIQNCGETSVDSGGPWCNAAPSPPSVSMNSSIGTNYTYENLTAYISLTDPNYDELFEIVDFRINNTSFNVLNMPFQIANTSLGVIRDFSTNENNGTNNGAIWTQYGYIGGAYQFDGSSSFINLSDQATMDLGGSFTLMAWIKADSVSAAADEYLISKYDYANDDRAIALLRTTDESLEFYIDDDGTSGTECSMDGETASELADLEWHFVAAVFDDSANKTYTYIDGTLDDDAACTVNQENNSADWTIGSSLNGATPDNVFDGTIDEVQILGRSLSGDQINRIYQDQLNHRQNLVLNLIFSVNTTLNSTGWTEDSSQFNNDGLLGDGNEFWIPTWNETGQIGGSYWFNGLDDMINVTDSASLSQTAQISIVVWAKDPPLNFTRINDNPEIIYARTRPEKVKPGDLLTFYAEIMDKYGINYASTTIPYEGGSDMLPMRLVNGTRYHGIWEVTWLVHDTKQKNYYSTVEAGNSIGLISSKTVKWYDPDASVYVYKFTDTENNSAYQKNGISTKPVDYTAEATAGEYTSLSSSNNARWTTKYAVNNNEYDTQIYSFTVNERIADINNLTINWEGYGCNVSTAYTNVSFWDVSTRTWYEVANRDYSSSTDATITGAVTSNIAKYVNSTSSKVVVRVTTRKIVKSTGTACSVDDECGSGFCRDGYCCDNTCSGTCKACDVSGSEGTCTFVPVNTDLDNECDTTNCGKGTCNGAGACDWYTSGERNCAACKTCNSATSTSCVNLADNAQDAEGSNLCNSECKKCSSGSCASQNGEDLFDHCSSTGCGTDTCASGACGYYTSGEHNCATCNTCTAATSPTCVALNNVKDEEGSSTCSATCDKCSSGSCVDQNGEDLFDQCDTTGCGTGSCASGVCGWYTSGERNCATCKTCTSASSTSCVNIGDNLQDSEGSSFCSYSGTVCQNCDGSGNCINQGSAEDLFGQCTASWTSCDNICTGRGPDGDCDGSAACDTNDATQYCSSTTSCSSGSCVAGRCNTATDSDGGNTPLTAGTCTHYGCSSGTCASSGYTDSCSSDTLTEYYISSNACTSTTYGCSSYCQGLGYDFGACSSGKCSCSYCGRLSCPSIFVWEKSGYFHAGTMLGLSNESISESDEISLDKFSVKEGTIELLIAEIEPENSYFDKLSLIVKDSNGLQTEVQEILPESPQANKELLSYTDNRFLTTEMRDKIGLTFNLPSLKDGWMRNITLFARGYYAEDKLLDSYVSEFKGDYMIELIKTDQINSPDLSTLFIVPNGIIEGDFIKVLIHVKDTVGIEKGFAYFTNEKGKDKVDFEIWKKYGAGTIYDAYWYAIWSSHDLEDKRYNINFTFLNKEGESTSGNISFQGNPAKEGTKIFNINEKWWTPEDSSNINISDLFNKLDITNYIPLNYQAQYQENNEQQLSEERNPETGKHNSLNADYVELRVNYNKYIVNDLPNDTAVVLTGTATNVSETGQNGIKNIMLMSGEDYIANFSVNFTQDVNLSDIVANTSDGKTVLKINKTVHPYITSNYTLMIPAVVDTGMVYICPYAESIEDVSYSCNGLYWITGLESVDFYYKVDVTGTGGGEGQADFNKTIIKKSGSYGLELNSSGEKLIGSINTQRVTAEVTNQEDWHQYAMTYNSSLIKLFIDGAEVASQAYDTAISDNTEPAIIGKYFSGFIDEVKIFNISLEESEINKMYLEGINSRRRTIVENETARSEIWTANVCSGDNEYISSCTSSNELEIQNSIPDLTSISLLTNLSFGGGLQNITPSGVSDIDEENLYLVCCNDTANTCAPTSAVDICSESSYANPYTGMQCSFTIPNVTGTLFVRCRTYDGLNYSAATASANFTVDSSVPKVAVHWGKTYISGVINFNASVNDTGQGLNDSTCQIVINATSPPGWQNAEDNYSNGDLSGFCNKTINTSSLINGTVYSLNFRVNDTTSNLGKDLTPVSVYVCNDVNPAGCGDACVDAGYHFNGDGFDSFTFETGEANCCGENATENYISNIISGSTYDACCDAATDCVDAVGVCRANTTETGALCTDNIDNDCDGLKDYDDSDCCPVISGAVFVVKNASANCMKIDQSGNIAIKGHLTTSCSSAPDTNDFIIKGANNLFFIDSNNCNACLSGDSYTNMTSISAGTNEFLVRNSSSAYVVKINSEGDLNTTGFIGEGCSI